MQCRQHGQYGQGLPWVMVVGVVITTYCGSAMHTVTENGGDGGMSHGGSSGNGDSPALQGLPIIITVCWWCAMFSSSGNDSGDGAHLWPLILSSLILHTGPHLSVLLIILVLLSCPCCLMSVCHMMLLLLWWFPSCHLVGVVERGLQLWQLVLTDTQDRVYSLHWF